jgi:hypothetical protein
MPVVPDSKYALKDLYQAIDLYDRKIAYCQNYEHFDSQEARTSAVQKLVTRRATAVKNARGMVNRGVECDAKHLPRSFKEQAATAKGAQ